MPGGLPACIGCSQFHMGTVGRFRFLKRKACRAGGELYGAYRIEGNFDKMKPKILVVYILARKRCACLWGHRVLIGCFWLEQQHR